MPGVPPVPDTDTSEYLETIKQRFANPKIGDTVRRLCFDGSNRQPKFICLSLADALQRGGSIEGLALESALWCRYCAGTTDAGETIEPNDPDWVTLTGVAQEARDRPEAWLGQRGILRRARRERDAARRLRPLARDALGGGHRIDAPRLSRPPVSPNRVVPAAASGRSRAEPGGQSRGIRVLWPEPDDDPGAGDTAEREDAG